MSGCHCDCCSPDPEGDDEFEEDDDTVSTFGQLPPAPPPRIITHPERTYYKPARR